MYLLRELKLSVAAVKGYQSAINYAFSLTGLDLTANKVIIRKFSSFEKMWPPKEVKPPEWNLTCPPYESLYSFSDKHWIMCFLLAVTSTKRAGEFHGLSFRVRHSRGWKPCTFSFISDFITKTWNLSTHDPRLEKFTVPFLGDVICVDRDELLLCLIRAFRKCFLWMEQY